jgi:hypothetical protein
MTTENRGRSDLTIDYQPPMRDVKSQRLAG